MRNIRLILLLTALFSNALAGDYQNSEKLRVFIGEMQQEHGFVAEHLEQLFAKVNRQQSILDAIARPAEKVRQWKDYRPTFVNPRRIAGGVSFWAKNVRALERAEREYGVPAQMIVAIIGVETSYGGNTGRYRVLDALATLAFDFPPREVFFRKELKEFLLMVREQQLDALSLKGSYAGAMGLPQFMPSSFRAFAVDFDGDGKIDIWNNPSDAIGSVANYFKQHGWTADSAVAERVFGLGEQADRGLTSGLEPERSAAELIQLGWPVNSSWDKNLRLSAFRLQGQEGAEYWLGLPNFYVITRYNRSNMYALAVYQLSEVLLNTRSPLN